MIVNASGEREEPKAALPPDLVRYLNGRRARLLGHGGTGALVLHCEDSSVVKYVASRADAVDGHHSSDLHLKFAQVALIHDTVPSLRNMVPPVEVVDLEQGSVLSMPFCPGRSPLFDLLDGDSVGFGRIVENVLQTLAPAYAARRSQVHPPVREYADRVARRLDYFGSFHARIIHEGDGAAPNIDGLAQLVHGVIETEDVLPKYRYFPVHGDLNLFNVIVNGPASGRFVLVDQRGVLDDWDPIYDVAKMLVSVGIQAPLELCRATVSWRGAPRLRDIMIRSDRRTIAAQVAGIDALRSVVMRWDLGDEFEPDPGRRWRRVLFAAGAHAMSEAACRVSVALTGSSEQRRWETAKAMAYLAFGESLLSQFKSGSRIDVPLPAVA